MAYCTYQDVEAEFKSLAIGMTGPVNQTKVSAFISQADAYINSKISTRYETPLTGGEGLTLLKMYSIMLVTERLRELMSTSVGSAKTDQEKDTVSAMKFVTARLNEIADGTVPLIGGIEKSTTQGVGSYLSTNADAPERTFKVDEDQW